MVLQTHTFFNDLHIDNARMIINRPLLESLVSKNTPSLVVTLYGYKSIPHGSCLIGNLNVHWTAVAAFKRFESSFPYVCCIKA